MLKLEPQRLITTSLSGLEEAERGGSRRGNCLSLCADRLRPGCDCTRIMDEPAFLLNPRLQGSLRLVNLLRTVNLLKELQLRRAAEDELHGVGGKGSLQHGVGGKGSLLFDLTDSNLGDSSIESGVGELALEPHNISSESASAKAARPLAIAPLGIFGSFILRPRLALRLLLGARWLAAPALCGWEASSTLWCVVMCNKMSLVLGRPCGFLDNIHVTNWLTCSLYTSLGRGFGLALRIFTARASKLGASKGNSNAKTS